MRLKTKKILGISLTLNSKKEILEFVQKGLENTEKTGQKSFILVTPNPEQVVLAGKFPHFADILNRADIAIPDGIGLVWADRFLHPKPHLQKVTGVQLMQDLAQLAADEGYTIGLIGGRGDVAVKALECLRQKYPRVLGWAEEAPELKIKSDQLEQSDQLNYYIEEITKKIKETKTQMIFVGFGAPKQEFFIEKLELSLRAVAKQSIRIASPLRKDSGQAERSRDDRKPILFMSVGGAFDEISGRLPMPPKFIDRLGLKWLWRLIIEPWRFRRQLSLFEFIWLVLQEKMSV